MQVTVLELVRFVSRYVMDVLEYVRFCVSQYFNNAEDEAAL